jgi:hypothetical protein
MYPYNVHNLYDEHIVQHQYCVKSLHVCLKRSCIGSFSSDFPKKKRVRRGEVGCTVKNRRETFHLEFSELRTCKGVYKKYSNRCGNGGMKFLTRLCNLSCFFNSVLLKNWLNILFYMSKIESEV